MTLVDNEHWPLGESSLLFLFIFVTKTHDKRQTQGQTYGGGLCLANLNRICPFVLRPFSGLDNKIPLNDTGDLTVYL